MSGVAVTLHSEFDGHPENPFANVFGYDIGSAEVTGPDFDDFCDEFLSTIMPHIQAVVSIGVTFTKMTVRDLAGGLVDYEHILPAGVQGSVGGDATPLFVAWGFQYVRGAPGQRSGAKRFGPCGETHMNAGIASGSALTLLSTLAGVLNDQLIVGAITWSPGIIHKTGASTGEIRYAREVIYKRVTSQNSRKR
jgi:hypothetical protein